MIGKDIGWVDISPDKYGNKDVIEIFVPCTIPIAIRRVAMTSRSKYCTKLRSLTGLLMSGLPGCLMRK